MIRRVVEEALPREIARTIRVHPKMRKKCSWSSDHRYHQCDLQSQSWRRSGTWSRRSSERNRLRRTGSLWSSAFEHDALVLSWSVCRSHSKLQTVYWQAVLVLVKLSVNRMESSLVRR